MITRNEIKEIGSLIKPHGINGEITAIFPPELDPGALSCVILDMDGIFVPFFIDEWRPKSTESILLRFEGVCDEMQAKRFSGKALYGLVSEITDFEDDHDDGFYTSDLLGFEVYDSGGKYIGRVKDYDDQTENVLLIVDTPDQKTIFLPLADELVAGFDAANHTISLYLPEGIVDLS